MRRATLVLTTISDPLLLHGYYNNFDRYGSLPNVDVIVIPDQKTPPSVFATCDSLRNKGLSIACPTLEEQDLYIQRAGLPTGFIPYNSDNRRNIGYLMAWERGADFLISIDDDNYCTDGTDYFGTHEDVFFRRQSHAIVDSRSRFFNICELLETDAATVYARGFPYFARHAPAETRLRSADADIMINAGLWLQDPDVDAITWLGVRPQVRAFKGQSRVLAPATWSPVNSQNTAVRRELIPAYYFIRMGYPLHGAKVDRYGDIFSGYFALACAKHLGGAARFGTPIADHRRNSHNYLRDAAAEWPAILLLEDVLAWLIEAPLCGSTGLEAYLSLSHGLDEAAERLQGYRWDDAGRGFIHQMTHLMRLWIAACRTVAPVDFSTLPERSSCEDLGSDDRIFGNGTVTRIRAADPAPVV